MDEPPQSGGFSSEELHSTFGNVVPVTDIWVQEVTGAAHHVAYARLFNVLESDGNLIITPSHTQPKYGLVGHNIIYIAHMGHMCHFQCTKLHI